MSCRISLTLAACLSLAGCILAHGQDASTTTPPDVSTNAAPADDVASLQAENASLKKELSDATQTIATLQAQLAQAGVTHQVPTANPPDATTPDTSTNAAPAGPQKALPLDDTNGLVTASAPSAAGTDAGPSKTYKVVKGDSLWKIAHKMYPGDTKNGVDKIQEANKDAIGGKPLKIGQVLIIPQ
jgi:nucleoid-associated protein YgaU